MIVSVISKFFDLFTVHRKVMIKAGAGQKLERLTSLPFLLQGGAVDKLNIASNI